MTKKNQQALKAVLLIPEATEAVIKGCIMTTDTAWHI